MLEVKDLHIKFHNRDREAVAGISFTIEDGEIMGLVGESGSGKTVTAMSIAGLLPRKQCDFTGDILLNGQDLLHAERKLLRSMHGKEIGVVFQEPMSSMDPLMKVGEQVEEVLRIHTDLSKEERKEKVLQVMREVELKDPEAVYEKYPHEHFLKKFSCCGQAESVGDVPPCESGVAYGRMILFSCRRRKQFVCEMYKKRALPG